VLIYSNKNTCWQGKYKSCFKLDILLVVKLYFSNNEDSELI
jgi:hypothetical protein